MNAGASSHLLAHKRCPIHRSVLFVDYMFHVDSIWSKWNSPGILVVMFHLIWSVFFFVHCYRDWIYEMSNASHVDFARSHMMTTYHRGTPITVQRLRIRICRSLNKITLFVCFFTHVELMKVLKPQIFQLGNNGGNNHKACKQPCPTLTRSIPPQHYKPWWHHSGDNLCFTSLLLGNPPVKGGSASQRVE